MGCFHGGDALLICLSATGRIELFFTVMSMESLFYELGSSEIQFGETQKARGGCLADQIVITHEFVDFHYSSL
jgi:hypothetical protein